MSRAYLLTCSCSGGKEKAEIAFNILKPNEPTPQVVKGKEAISKLASRYLNDHLRAISKLNGNFAYYIDIADNSNIIEEYDLIRGVKIK